MGTIPYNLDIPDGPNNPSQDQPKMKTNTDSINTIIGVDHYSFGSTGSNDGWHKQSTYPLLSVKPTVIAGQGAVYTKDVGGGVIQLFYEKQDGTEIQITSGGGLFNVPTILTGTFTTTNAFTDIVAVPANVYGYVIFFNNGSVPFQAQISAFFSTGANTCGFSTRVVSNSSSKQDPVELNNFSPALNLQGMKDDFSAATYNFRVHYWSI